MEKEKMDKFKALVEEELTKEVNNSLELECIANTLNLVDYTTILANLSTIELNKKQEEAVNVLTNVAGDGSLDKMLAGLDMEKLKDMVSNTTAKAGGLR